MPADRDYTPAAVAGALLRHERDGIVPRGSCFALSHPDWFVTARHCLDDDLDHPATLYDVWTGERARKVLAARLHPEADLAVLRVAPDPWETRPPFEFGGMDAWPASGDDCGMFGYAWSLVDGAAKAPGSALVTGPMLGFSTTTRLALDTAPGSMSRYKFGGGGIACAMPEGGGFSGGPVFALAAPTVAVGLVAKDLHELTTGEHQTFALALGRCSDWIDDAIEAK